MEKIKNKIIEILLKEYVLGYFIKGWEKVGGYKTQICVVAWVAVFLCEFAGWIEPELAQKVLTGLEVAGGFSLMQKLKRYDVYKEQLKSAISEEKK